MMKKKVLMLMVLLLSMFIQAKADHTMALSLADVKVNGATYANPTVSFGSSTWKAAYWDLSSVKYAQSFTTATVNFEALTKATRISVRYYDNYSSETTDATVTAAVGATSASVTIPATATKIASLRVGNGSQTDYSVTLTSASLTGLRSELSLDMSTLGAGWGSSYDSSTQTVTFGPGENDGAVETWKARGWAVGNAYLNDYNTAVVELAAAADFSYALEIGYTNTSDASSTARTTVKAGNSRVSVRVPTDVKSITNIYLKNGSNPTNAKTESIRLTKAYMTTDVIDYFDMADATSTWSSDKSSYDVSTYTITWTAPTYHGWYVGNASYNEYKTIVLEFQPSPVSMTGHLRYKATSEASITDFTYTVPAGATMLTLAVPETIYQISAIYLEPTSACSLTLTKAYATSKEYETSKTITLSTTETTCADIWASGYLLLSKETMALAQAGDQLAINVSAISGTDASPCVALQTGSFTNFSPAVSTFSLSDKSAPVTATFTLTEAMLNAIHGNVDGVNSGLVVKGSGFTFSQVDLLHNIYKIKGLPATNLWTGEEVITWNAPSNVVTLPASAFALAESGMKLRMSFSGLKLGAQGRLVNGSWVALPDADSYETLKTDWGNYYEFDITDDMLAELQTNGVRISGVGYTLTSVDIIDPECEYDIVSSFDTADIKAWEPGDGTPNLSVTLTNNESYEVTVPVSASLMTDMFADYNTYSQNVTLAAGETRTVDLEFSDLTPGFYRMAANANGNQLCTYYIGYNPTAIVSPNDAQSDFWQFWDTWKTRLAAIDMNAQLTLLEEQSTGARNVYEVRLTSVPETVGGEPVNIWGYYAEPKAEGTYPAIIRFHGTDSSGSGTLTIPGTDDMTGWCEFRFSARGQMLSRVKDGNTKYLDENSKPDFYSYGLGSNDNHYYRYVYLDTRRALDFVYAQAKVNRNAIFAQGGSQGGCLTYVCAALSDGRIRAIAPHITGHADFVHTMEIVGWPTNIFNNWINTQVEAGTYDDYEAGKAALLQHQSYFDTKNFASRITCPVITNFSLQDNTDGPHLNIAPYNLLEHVDPADKAYSINPFKGHASADDWETTYMAFFNNYLETPLQQSFFLNSGSEGWATLCLDFKAVVPDGTEVYTATSKDDVNSEITLKRFSSGSVMDANTAVVVKGDAQTDYEFIATTDATTVTGDNLLKGVTERTLISTLNSGNGIMVLGKKDDIVGFYSTSASYLPAHRAYLEKPSSGSARGYTFTFDENETTGISSIHNSQCIMHNEVFNLAGQRIAKPAKGLYIVNGKKVVIK